MKTIRVKISFRSIQHLLLCFLASCILGACNNRSELKIEDLKFPNHLAQAIINQKVDTSFLLDENCMCAHDFWPPTEEGFYGKIIYNEKGQEVRVIKYEIMGTIIDFNYDQKGLVSYKNYSTDFDAISNAEYEFDPKKRVLKQIWQIHKYVDTCFFYFDPDGKLIKSIEFENNDKAQGRDFKILYKYFPNGQLSSKLTFYYLNLEAKYYISENQAGRPILSNSHTIFYNSLGRLDSTITYYNYLTNLAHNYVSKTYFDNNGLRTKTIERDTMRTIYIHSFRE